MSEKSNSISASLSKLLNKYSSQPIDAQQDELTRLQLKIDHYSQSYHEGYKDDYSHKSRQVYSETKMKAQNKKEACNNWQQIDEYFDILLNNEVGMKNKQDSKTQNRVQSQNCQEREIKIMTPIKTKKQKKARKNKEQAQKMQFIHPQSSFVCLEVNKQKIVNQIKQSLVHQNMLMQETLKLGMKPAKTLGLVRSKREMDNIMNYLETGQIPSHYLSKFQSLLKE